MVAGREAEISIKALVVRDERQDETDSETLEGSARREGPRAFVPGH